MMKKYVKKLQECKYIQLHLTYFHDHNKFSLYIKDLQCFTMMMIDYAVKMFQISQELFQKLLEALHCFNVRFQEHLVNFSDKSTLCIIIDEFVVARIITNCQNCIIVGSKSANTSRATRNFNLAKTPFGSKVFGHQFVRHWTKEICSGSHQGRCFVASRVLGSKDMNCAMA